MKYRLFAALAALSLALPAPAAAQFTTVVAPPRKVIEAEAQAAAAAAAAVPRDTGHRATLQAMSAWVDSVAGAPAPLTVDSASGAIAADSAVSSTAVDRPGTTRFQDGARAPDTASPLPIILVSGIGMMLLGLLVMVGSRRTPAYVDARRRRAP